MATHPVEHDEANEPEPGGESPNPTRLPVEPEFGPQPPAAEPEDPAPKAPAI